MMDRIFRIDFYPQDWLIDTQRMRNDDRGLYIQIVSLIYANRGPIECDVKWISKVANVSSRFAAAAIERLEHENFIQLSGGKIGQKRAENELEAKRNHLEQSARGGRKKAQNEAKANNIRKIDSTGKCQMVASSAPAPSPMPKAAPAIDDQICREEILPSSWHDIAEQRGISDERIYASWRKFKDQSSHPWRLKNWKGWIARERVTDHA